MTYYDYINQSRRQSHDKRYHPHGVTGRTRCKYRGFIKRFIRHLLFMDKEERMFSCLAWLIVLNGLLCFIALWRVFQ